MSLHALAYVSTASWGLSPEEIDQMLLDARRFNAEVGVTGALLHHGGNFFQYLEGPEDAVNQVFNRIVRARRHHDVTEIYRAEVSQHLFADWLMGFVEAPQSLLQALAQARWTEAVAGELGQRGEGSPGGGLLLDFWRRSVGRQVASAH